MPAIPRHETGTTDAAWDGPEMETRVRSDEDYDYYRRIYAWYDPDGDRTVKTTYRFIHHMVSGNGEPGDANIRACQTGIGVLNGGRGGTTIPDADRQGVYNHLARHLRDADIEPPELRMIVLPRETRAMPVAVIGLDEETETEDMIVEGYAIRFNEPAEWTFGDMSIREVILPSALDTTDMKDVPLKYNHSDNIMIMARTRNKTLELIPDDKGLKIRAKLANTTAGRDLYELIKRGDVGEMSFAFTVRGDHYDRSTHTRTITDIEKIWDVSAVDAAAYETTSIYARSMYDLEREYMRKSLERDQLRRKLIAKTKT